MSSERPPNPIVEESFNPAYWNTTPDVITDQSLTPILANYVDLTTTQTISGEKTFSTIPLNTATQPAFTDSTTNIPSTAWAQGAITNAPILDDFVDLTTTQTITGEKIFASMPYNIDTQPAFSASNTMMPTTAWVQGAIDAKLTTNIQNTQSQITSPYTANLFGGGGYSGKTIKQNFCNLTWTPVGAMNSVIYIKFNLSVSILYGGTYLGGSQNNNYTDSGIIGINPYQLALGSSFSSNDPDVITAGGGVSLTTTQTPILTQYSQDFGTWGASNFPLYISYNTAYPNQVNFFWVNRNDDVYNGALEANQGYDTTTAFSAELLSVDFPQGYNVSLNPLYTQIDLTPTITMLNSSSPFSTYSITGYTYKVDIFVGGAGGVAGGGSYPDSGLWAIGGAGGSGGLAMVLQVATNPFNSTNTTFDFQFNYTASGYTYLNNLIVQGVSKSLTLLGRKGNAGATGQYITPINGGTGGTSEASGTITPYSPIYTLTGGTGGGGNANWNYASPVPEFAFPVGGVMPTTTPPAVPPAYNLGFVPQEGYGTGQSNLALTGYTSAGYVNESAGVIGEGFIQIVLYPSW